MPRWLKVFVEAGKPWNADNAFKHSASVAFYTLFSLAPKDTAVLVHKEIVKETGKTERRKT